MTGLKSISFLLSDRRAQPHGANPWLHLTCRAAGRCAKSALFSPLRQPWSGGTWLALAAGMASRRITPLGELANDERGAVYVEYLVVTALTLAVAAALTGFAVQISQWSSRARAVLSSESP